MSARAFAARSGDRERLRRRSHRRVPVPAGVAAAAASRDGGPVGATEPAGAGVPGWSGLTPRERSVAVLAGQALTNQQIAHQLHISPHTVNFHLRHIFRKLAIDSRVRLARLVDPVPVHRPR